MNFARGLSWPHSFYAMLVLVVGLGAVSYGFVAMFYGRVVSLYPLLDALLGAALVLVALAWGTEPAPAPVPTPTPPATKPEVAPVPKRAAPAREPTAPRPVWAEDWSAAPSPDTSARVGSPGATAEVVFSEIDRLSVELSRRRKTP